MQLKQIIEDEFPLMEVIGSGYPVPVWKQTLVKGIAVLQMGLMGVVVMGDRVLPQVGIQLPPWVLQLTANKYVTGLGVWMVGNVIQSSIVQSGAFEIYYDERLVFSKLEAGQMPELRVLLTTINGLYTDFNARLPSTETIEIENLGLPDSYSNSF
jgi:selT/selW/selH-like putative selenoprotein